MPVVTHSKASPGKPPGLVASPLEGKKICPRRFVECPQDNAVVAGHEERVNRVKTY